jgi:hypothetical protein
VLFDRFSGLSENRGVPSSSLGLAISKGADVLRNVKQVTRGACQLRLMFGTVRLVRARCALVLVAVAIGSLAALSAGAVAAHVTKPQRPKAGPWQTTAEVSTSGGRLSGSFIVTSSHYVTALHGTLQNAAPAACGTGTVTVINKVKIIYSKGFAWIVGRSRGLEFLGPDSVLVSVGGQTVKGTLDIFFVAARSVAFGGPTKGSLDWGTGAGACDLSFDAAPG